MAPMTIPTSEDAEPEAPVEQAPETPPVPVNSDPYYGVGGAYIIDENGVRVPDPNAK